MSIDYKPADLDSQGASEVNLRDSSGVELLGQKVQAASLPVVIASNQSNVPVTVSDGTDTLVINTDGSLNVALYPYPVVKAQKYFGVNIEYNIASTGEQNALLVRNPAGSGKNLFVNRIICAVLGTATRYRVRVYQKPTVTTAGTSNPIFNNLVTASPAASVMATYTGPTTSSRGTRIRTYAVEGTDSIDDSFDFGLDVTPGYDLLITGDFDATNKVLAISLQWSEE